MLDEMAEVPNTGGVLLTFDDFVEGVEIVRHPHPAADEMPAAREDRGLSE